MPWWWPFEKPWVVPIDESVEEFINDDGEIVEDVAEPLDGDGLVEDPPDVDLNKYERRFDWDELSDEDSSGATPDLWIDEQGRLHDTDPYSDEPFVPDNDNSIEDISGQYLDDYEGRFDGDGYSDPENTDLPDYEEYEHPIDPVLSTAEYDLRRDLLPARPGDDSGEGFSSSSRRCPLRRALSSQLRDDFPSPPAESLDVDAQGSSAQALIDIDADLSDIEVVDLTGDVTYEPATENDQTPAEDVPAVVNFGILERPSADRNALIGLSFGPQLENLVRRGYTPAEAFAFVGGLFDSHVDAYGAYDVTTGRYRDFFTPQMTTLYHFLCGEILAVGRIRLAFQHQQDEARARVRQIMVNSGHPYTRGLELFYNRWMLRGFDSYAIYDMIRDHETNQARAQITVEDLESMDVGLIMDDPTERLQVTAPEAYSAMVESWENAQASQPRYGGTYRSPASSPLRGLYPVGSTPPTTQQGQSTSPSARSSQTFGREARYYPSRSPRQYQSPRPNRQGPPTDPTTQAMQLAARNRSSPSGNSLPSGGSSTNSSYHPPARSPSIRSPPITPDDRAFDEFMTRNRPRSGKRTFKDYRVKKVDPLRYENRLAEPRRLPNTPTKSHLPPSPRRRGLKPTKCDACGRAFRPRGKGTAAAKRKSERVRKGVERLES